MAQDRGPKWGWATYEGQALLNSTIWLPSGGSREECNLGLPKNSWPSQPCSSTTMALSRRPILPLLLVKAHHTNLRRIPLTGNIDVSRLGGLPPTIPLLV